MFQEMNFGTWTLYSYISGLAVLKHYLHDLGDN